MGLEDFGKSSPGGVTGDKQTVPFPALVIAVIVVVGFFVWAASTGLFTQDYGPRALTKKELKQAERKAAKKERTR
jgi:hypothetical protein